MDPDRNSNQKPEGRLDRRTLLKSTAAVAVTSAAFAHDNASIEAKADEQGTESPTLGAT